jgi:hypothetical protein
LGNRYFRDKFWGRFRNNWLFRGLLLVASDCFLGDLEFSFNLVLSNFFFFLLLLVTSEFLYGIGRRRDEGAGGGVLSNPVSTVAALGSIFRDCVSRSAIAHAVQGIQVQLFIP